MSISMLCLSKAYRFDFEDGILDWDKTGTAFNNQPTFGDNPTARNRGQPANQQGDWWIGGFEKRPSKETPAGEIQGDGPQGTLTSPFFHITGEEVSFLIGGGCDIHTVRAELVINNQVGLHVINQSFPHGKFIMLITITHVSFEQLLRF